MKDNNQINTNLLTCLIIGGGISGLILANQLRRTGIKTTILDKGRGIGGRLATRRITYSADIEGVFDYGVQHFTVRNPKFQTWVDEWQQQGVIQAEKIVENNEINYYRGVASNRSLAKYLAQNLDIYTNTKVVNLNWQNSQWIITTENNDIFQSDMLAMTPPIPQSLALLDISQISLSPKIRERLEQISYSKCIAVLALLEKPSQIPQPGRLLLEENILTSISSNYQKGISPYGYAVTLHAGEEFSESHWDKDNKTISDRLFKAASPWLNSQVITYQVHRWRYSQPRTVYGKPYLALPQPPLVMAGDGFVSPNLEGAVLSGLAAAEYISKL